MIKINIGSGYTYFDSFIRIDSDPKCKPDYILDLEQEKLPFNDNSVEEVVAHHILEHLGNGFFHVMLELYRVCKHGAIIDIKVPHPRHDTFLIDPTHKRPIYPLTMEMFSKKINEQWIAECRGDSCLALQYDVDFELITYDFVLDPYYIPIFQKISEQECEFIARSQNNVIMEITMKLMVIKNDIS